jgi:hypothetical protein
MQGVILFADDKIHQSVVQEDGNFKRSDENSLFNSLNKELPVLGVHSLDLASKSIGAIGSFKAIILDWQFPDNIADGEIKDLDDGTAQMIKPPSTKEEATLTFLKENDFYTLIYILSEKDIESVHGQSLRERFGDRIQFKVKTTLNDTEATKNQILTDINNWQENHLNLSIPLLWSCAINQAMQQIFKELSDADVNWLKDVFDTATNDGINAELFIIDIFQSLLAENLIQSQDLINALKLHVNQGTQVKDEKSISRLFSRLFYSKLLQDSPIMTGDICRIDAVTFCILISPECDIKTILADDNNELDVFVFKSDSFESYLLKYHNDYTKADFASLETGTEKKKKKLEAIKKIFNQSESKLHFLPSFPCNEEFNKTVVIDFSISLKKIKTADFKGFERKHKLNSPFIQQLRQRYISYFGRVGVPALPISLRNYNLK